MAVHRLVLASAQTNTSHGLKKLRHVTHPSLTISSVRTPEKALISNVSRNVELVAARILRISSGVQIPLRCRTALASASVLIFCRDGETPDVACGRMRQAFGKQILFPGESVAKLCQNRSAVRNPLI
ncbi:MAG TPA: hypothetical protein PKN95_15360 [Verrucomicrobiota bacterium]|nr:hypothetical protein [Verrucomicrobiota bacterium]HNT16022.1 hypothetical protein [Verrucomicrobiota bacterium]